MDQTTWKHVTIDYPGTTPEQREHRAVAHLTSALPAAETDRLITAWFYVRKGPWRIRYLLAQPSNSDPVHPLLTDGTTWTSDIYEPETHAFGGPGGMNAAHALFHGDSRNLLTYLRNAPTDRPERSLVLFTALMRAAGLEPNEQGDVWAKVAEQRPALPTPAPTTEAWTSYSNGIRQLLLGQARTELVGADWLSTYEATGHTLRALRHHGELTRGIRAIIALHVLFAWNRLGLPTTTQALLARAAMQATFGDEPCLPDTNAQITTASQHGTGLHHSSSPRT
ncbi:thiopeptide-type bacteriocin biosynthesis protein [Promicromonospora sp. MS192]|uniref:thiopeptide-type bacteriocin biosynthesis protein n=1 Tax=Promicromonospora sp. MS192 TaxID=3412684 RepID=UPI003C30C638